MFKLEEIPHSQPDGCERDYQKKFAHATERGMIKKRSKKHSLTHIQTTSKNKTKQIDAQFENRLHPDLNLVRELLYKNKKTTFY